MFFNDMKKLLLMSLDAMIGKDIEILKQLPLKLIEQVLNPSSEVVYFLKTSLKGCISRVETPEDRR